MAVHRVRDEFLGATESRAPEAQLAPVLLDLEVGDGDQLRGAGEQRPLDPALDGAGAVAGGRAVAPAVEGEEVGESQGVRAQHRQRWDQRVVALGVDLAAVALDIEDGGALAAIVVDPGMDEGVVVGGEEGELLVGGAVEGVGELLGLDAGAVADLVAELLLDVALTCAGEGG